MKILEFIDSKNFKNEIRWDDEYCDTIKLNINIINNLDTQSYGHVSRLNRKYLPSITVPYMPSATGKTDKNDLENNFGWVIQLAWTDEVNDKIMT